MNSLEKNAGNAVRETLIGEDATLAAVPPVIWDDAGAPTDPSVSIKCTQGAEIVSRYGVYRIAVEITGQGKANDQVVDDLKARVVRILLDDQVAHTLLTTDHFHCFAVEAGTASISNSGIDRIFSVKFDLVGFDLDRHA